MAVVSALVLTTERLAAGAKVSVSVADLAPVPTSSTPGGAVTDAVLATVPVAPGAIVAVRVNVAVPDTGNDTVVLMFPVPAALPQAPPALLTHVQLAPTSVPGKVSVTVAPVTADGPALLTTIE